MEILCTLINCSKGHRQVCEAIHQTHLTRVPFHRGYFPDKLKMALNAVMERDSENPTPTLDKEPFFNFFIDIQKVP